MTTRIDKMLIVPIVTTFDDEGRPVDERPLTHNGQPVTVFRAGTPDVWAAVDAVTQTKEP